MFFSQQSETVKGSISVFLASGVHPGVPLLYASTKSFPELWKYDYSKQ